MLPTNHSSKQEFIQTKGEASNLVAFDVCHLLQTDFFRLNGQQIWMFTVSNGRSWDVSHGSTEQKLNSTWMGRNERQTLNDTVKNFTSATRQETQLSWKHKKSYKKKKMKNSIPVIVVSVFFIGWVIWFLFWRNRFSDRTWNRCKWIVSLELSWNVSQQPSYYDCYWTKLTKEFQQLKPSCNCQHLIRFTAYPHTAASLMLWRTF